MKKEELLTTCFGLGHLPWAPGTWGSLPPVVLYMTTGILLGPTPAVIVLLFLLSAGCVVTAVYSRKVIEQTGSKDPGKIVSDEVAGAALTLLLMQWFAPNAGYCLIAGLGFGLFRVFDILKPWPCKRLEKLPAGWGILADDLMAGVYAAFVWIAGQNLGILEGLSRLFGSGHEMSGGFAFFLGAVQGLTEFLPVSSSGHLVFFESFADGINTESPEMLLFDLCLHLGTVLSILVVFRKAIVRFIQKLASSFGSGLTPRKLYVQKPAVRFAVLAMAATATTAIIYVLFKDPLESARSLRLVAFMWLVTAGMLLAADFRHGRKGLRDFGLIMAVVIGVFQGVAILPGISRSGATICAAILLGLRPRWAVEFSFLISIPAIVGGAAIQAISNSQSLMNGDVPLAYLLIGMVSAFILGIISLKILIRLSKRRKLRYFAAYCALLATITLVYFL